MRSAVFGRIDRRDFLRAGLATAGAAAGVSVTAGARAKAGQPAVVYHNGTIITMEGDAAEYVEAVAVKDGRIAYAGGLDAAVAAVGSPTLIDLQGRTLLPGFIDTWGHFTLFAQQTLGVNLGYFSDVPPNTKADVLALLKAASPFNDWVVGNSYYAALLSDGPLTLADLDAAFPDTPVLISTLSTLTGQLNTAGIAKLGLTPATPVPQPGQIVKDPHTGALTGELLFAPFLAARTAAVGTYPQARAIETFRAAEALLVQQGYTTVQTYQLLPDEIADLRTAFDQDAIAVDVIGLPSVSDDTSGKIVQDADWTWGAYSHGDRGLKIPGYQVATDAAPQLRLAAFTRPYLDTTGFAEGWKGVLFAEEIVEKWVDYAYAHDIQLFAYSNGDAGIDLSLAAIEKAIAAHGAGADRRTIISHSYFVRPDQLAAYQRLGIAAAMMPPHFTLYADEQMKLLGPERASMESPLASAVRLGINTSIHCDCPSASPNIMEAIGTAVTRTTLSGRVLGPQECLDPYTALLGFTRNAAHTYREENIKGTITAGKIADLVILERNPLTVRPETIKDIAVVETVKRGVVVYSSAGSSEDSQRGRPVGWSPIPSSTATAPG